MHVLVDNSSLRFVAYVGEAEDLLKPLNMRFDDKMNNAQNIVDFFDGLTEPFLLFGHVIMP